jgi:hypothetical protein
MTLSILIDLVCIQIIMISVQIFYFLVQPNFTMLFFPRSAARTHPTAWRDCIFARENENDSDDSPENLVSRGMAERVNDFLCFSF